MIHNGQPEALTLPTDVTLGDGPPGVGKALHFGKEGVVQLPNVPEIDTDKPLADRGMGARFQN